jgi:hypothetical protein
MEIQCFLERKRKLLTLINIYHTIIQNHIQFNKKTTADVLFDTYFIYCSDNISSHQHIINLSYLAHDNM